MTKEDMAVMIANLQHPFPYSDVEWRVLQCGSSGKGVWARIAAYINSRAIMSRLDAVVGPDCWQTSFDVIDAQWTADGCKFGGGMICTLSLKIDGEWISKADGANPRNTEPFKSCISDSLKRAAVQWGISRYLYQLGDIYADIIEKKAPGSHYGKTKDGTAFFWVPPPVTKMPRWMLPGDMPVVAKRQEEPSSEVADKMKNYIVAFNLNEGQDSGTAMKNLRSRIDKQLKDGGITDDQYADVIENYYIPLWTKLAKGEVDG